MLRLLGFFKILLIFNLFAFSFAHQKIQVFRLSYDIRNKEIQALNLVDRNLQLRYNVARAKSPEHIENILVANQTKAGLSSDKRIVVARFSPRNITNHAKKIDNQTSVEFSGSKLFDIFIGGVEAEAQVK